LPLRSPEILLRRTGLRIGYDFLRENHVILMDAAHVVIEARPLEEASNNEAIMVQGRLASHPIRAKINEALVIYADRLSAAHPEERLRKMSEILSLVSLSTGEEVREEKPGTRVIVRRQGVHLRVEPHVKYVEFTLSPGYTRRAEHLRVEAIRPTLVNVLMDRMQIASLYYVTPVVVRVEEAGDETRINIRPFEELRATGKNQRLYVGLTGGGLDEAHQ